MIGLREIAFPVLSQQFSQIIAKPSEATHHSAVEQRQLIICRLRSAAPPRCTFLSLYRPRRFVRRIFRSLCLLIHSSPVYKRISKSYNLLPFHIITVFVPSVKYSGCKNSSFSPLLFPFPPLSRSLSPAAAKKSVNFSAHCGTLLH